MATERFQKILEERRNGMDAHFSRLTAEQALPKPKNYLALVDQYLADHPETTRAQAMRMVTRAHPDLHAEWIRQVNQTS